MCEFCYGVAKLVSGALLVGTGLTWLSEAVSAITYKSPKIYIYRGYPNEDHRDPQAEVTETYQQQQTE